MGYNTNYGTQQPPEYQTTYGGDSTNGYSGSQTPQSIGNAAIQSKTTTGSKPADTFMSAAQQWWDRLNPQAKRPVRDLTAQQGTGQGGQQLPYTGANPYIGQANPVYGANGAVVGQGQNNGGAVAASGRGGARPIDRNAPVTVGGMNNTDDPRPTPAAQSGFAPATGSMADAVAGILGGANKTPWGKPELGGGNGGINPGGMYGGNVPLPSQPGGRGGYVSGWESYENPYIPPGYTGDTSTQSGFTPTTQTAGQAVAGILGGGLSPINVGDMSMDLEKKRKLKIRGDGTPAPAPTTDVGGLTMNPKSTGVSSFSNNMTIASNQPNPYIYGPDGQITGIDMSKIPKTDGTFTPPERYGGNIVTGGVGNAPMNNTDPVKVTGIGNTPMNNTDPRPTPLPPTPATGGGGGQGNALPPTGGSIGGDPMADWITQNYFGGGGSTSGTMTQGANIHPLDPSQYANPYTNQLESRLNQAWANRSQDAYRNLQTRLGNAGMDGGAMASAFTDLQRQLTGDQAEQLTPLLMQGAEGAQNRSLQAGLGNLDAEARQRVAQIGANASNFGDLLGYRGTLAGIDQRDRSDLLNYMLGQSGIDQRDRQGLLDYNLGTARIGADVYGMDQRDRQFMMQLIQQMGPEQFLAMLFNGQGQLPGAVGTMK